VEPIADDRPIPNPAGARNLADDAVENAQLVTDDEFRSSTNKTVVVRQTRLV